MPDTMSVSCMDQQQQACEPRTADSDADSPGAGCARVAPVASVADEPARPGGAQWQRQRQQRSREPERNGGANRDG